MTDTFIFLIMVIILQVYTDIQTRQILLFEYVELLLC